MSDSSQSALSPTVLQVQFGCSQSLQPIVTSIHHHFKPCISQLQWLPTPSSSSPILSLAVSTHFPFSPLFCLLIRSFVRSSPSLRNTFCAFTDNGSDIKGRAHPPPLRLHQEQQRPRSGRLERRSHRHTAHFQRRVSLLHHNTRTILY